LDIPAFPARQSPVARFALQEDSDEQQIHDCRPSAPCRTHLGHGVQKQIVQSRTIIPAARAECAGSIESRAGSTRSRTRTFTAVADLVRSSGNFASSSGNFPDRCK